MIGKLLGHAKVQTTARYAHLGRHSVKVAAVRISDSLEADMDTPPVTIMSKPGNGSERSMSFPYRQPIGSGPMT